MIEAVVCHSYGHGSLCHLCSFVCPRHVAHKLMYLGQQRKAKKKTFRACMSSFRSSTSKDILFSSASTSVFLEKTSRCLMHRNPCHLMGMHILLLVVV